MQPAATMSSDLPMVAKFLLAAKGDHILAHTIAANNRASDRVLRILGKAAVSAGTTLDGDFGEVLVDVRIAQSAFFGSLRTRSVFFRLLDSGFRLVPLRTYLGIVSASATAWVVGEGAPKPLSRLTLSSPSLAPKKVAALVCMTQEVARDTSAAGMSVVNQELRGAVSDVVDEALFGIVMAGAPSTPSVDMTADLTTLLNTVNVSGAGALFWAMSVDVANRAAVLDTRNGAMSPLGGEMLGLPALVSSTIPAGTLRLINAAAIAANADSIGLEVSDQADIVMADDPAMPAAMVSMFETNSIALKAEVSFAAEKTRADAVGEITGITWPAA
ncbi:phage major capsid protein [Mesorhizobium sp. M0060]|uniref:phage major capsid family protein n=1 Tax=Mesorhizobium sp. M0060 TaxID=2956866 RepID=UPI00333902B1